MTQIRLRCEIDPGFVLTDNEAIIKALREVPSTGAHSSELRRFEFTGNPSQRVSELRDRGYEIRVEEENRGKRPGIRIWLVSEPPSGAVSAPPTPDLSDGAASEGALFELPHVSQLAINDDLEAA